METKQNKKLFSFSQVRCRLSLSGQNCPATLSARPLDTGHSALLHHPCDRAASTSPNLPSNSPKRAASSSLETATPVALGSVGGGIVREEEEEEEDDDGVSSSQPRQTVTPSSGDSSRAATGQREEEVEEEGFGGPPPCSFFVAAAAAAVPVVVPAARRSSSLLGAQAFPRELVRSLARRPARSCLPLVG